MKFTGNPAVLVYLQTKCIFWEASSNEPMKQFAQKNEKKNRRGLTMLSHSKRLITIPTPKSKSYHRLASAIRNHSFCLKKFPFLPPVFLAKRKVTWSLCSKSKMAHPLKLSVFLPPEAIWRK